MRNRRRTIDLASQQFFKLDKWLLAEKGLKKLSPTAKLLYVVLKDREELSLKNSDKFTDSEGHLFQYFDQEKASELLGVSLTAIKKAFKDLKAYKLIESVRQGLGKPNRLYLLDVEVSNDTLNELAYKNKKASTEPPVEAKQVMQKANLKKTNITNITQDESNSNTNIENNTKKEESIKINNVKKSFVPNFKLNPKIHKGLSTNFLNYGTDEELEQMLLENQRKKYREEKLPSSNKDKSLEEFVEDLLEKLIKNNNLKLEKL